jgi:hypothetical protein
MWAKSKTKIPQTSGFRCLREKVVEIIGFEPMTSCMPCKRSSQLSYTPILGSKYRRVSSTRKTFVTSADCLASTAFNRSMKQISQQSSIQGADHGTAGYHAASRITSHQSMVQITQYRADQYRADNSPIVDQF